MPQAAAEPFTEHPTPADPEPNPTTTSDPTPTAASEPSPQPAMAQQLNRMEARKIQFMAYTQDVKAQYLECITL
ncbi:hypothetical protein V6N13_108575 [Hibiscus sabdariffa]